MLAKTKMPTQTTVDELAKDWLAAMSGKMCAKKV
eukprot:CAMPEP_0178371006 /NCGR_PEP_ID=MMETSP0689_2-20121128/599_1 /TAXON_ID=160604 /ORGANISM="Amphidinium massartii, Strain CS-259" /LENGTH=33 /DNA_ID= /DNA_START= /DNA_END= /DNA_ORIENTATION=